MSGNFLGPIKLLPASKADVDEIKKYNRLSSIHAGFKQSILHGKRFSSIAPKPAPPSQVTNVAVKNIQGVTMTTITMTTPVTHKPLNVISSNNEWQSQININRTGRYNKTVLSDVRQVDTGTKRSGLTSSHSSKPVFVVTTNANSCSTLNPVTTYTTHSSVHSQPIQNSRVVSGRLSHMIPSSSISATSTVTVPQPVFVIRTPLNQVAMNTSGSLGYGKFFIDKFSTTTCDIIKQFSKKHLSSCF